MIALSKVRCRERDSILTDLEGKLQMSEHEKESLMHKILELRNRLQ